jgi:hypothetical protein
VRGDLYTGWTNLAGNFPPSLNTSDDVTALKNFESPDCHGVDMTKDGQLAAGTIPAGTARQATTKRVGIAPNKVTYNWYYERLWVLATDKLVFGAKYYDDVYVPQGLGKVKAYQTLVGFQPCLKSQMWLYGANGSQFINNAIADSGQFDLGQLIQEMHVNTGKGTSALTVDEVPYCQNTTGIYSYTDGAVKEWTRPIRNSLGTFATEVALTANYQKKYLIGTAAFGVDLNTGKLFDYGTTSFLFTTRTMAGESYRPFAISDISFSIQFSSDTTAGTISWATKCEDNDWVDEKDITVTAVDGLKTQIIRRVNNPVTSTHKFAIKLTGLSSNISIRSIDMSVVGLATGSFAA